MCTAVASQIDSRITSGWVYTVSVRYLIRNVQMIVDNDTIDLSPIPYDVMMEIAQSEEIRAPEVQLYCFLRMWAKPLQQKLTRFPLKPSRLGVVVKISNEVSKRTVTSTRTNPRSCAVWSRRCETAVSSTTGVV